jgi:hypothetical protein
MKWVVKKQKMNDEWYYMIYKRVFFGWFDIFWERWNTEESVMSRVKELKKPNVEWEKVID